MTNNGSLNGRRRVVITGLGALTPLGNDVETSWENLIAGRSGAAEIPQFDSSVNMSSAPEWDSLNHVQLLSAIEKKFGVEISPDEAFKLTSADRLVQYLHGILKGKQ